MSKCKICKVKEALLTKPYCGDESCKKEYHRQHHIKYHAYRKKKRKEDQKMYKNHHHIVQENTRPVDADISPEWQKHIENMKKYYEKCMVILEQERPNQSINISPEEADLILARHGIKEYLRNNYQVRT